MKSVQTMILRELIKALPLIAITCAAAVGAWVFGLWPDIHNAFCVL